MITADVNFIWFEIQAKPRYYHPMNKKKSSKPRSHITWSPSIIISTKRAISAIPTLKSSPKSWKSRNQHCQDQNLINEAIALERNGLICKGTPACYELPPPKIFNFEKVKKPTKTKKKKNQLKTYIISIPPPVFAMRGNTIPFHLKNNWKHIIHPPKTFDRKFN